MNLVLLQCADCSVEFGITEATRLRRKLDGESFHCPNGHANVYRPSETDQLRQRVAELENELAQHKQRADYWEGNYDDLWESYSELRQDATLARRQAAGYKSAWSRLKQKVANETAMA